MGTQVLRIKINGQPLQLEVSPSTSLLDVLREHAGLTGAKLGCGRGECGACTVILNGKAVASCILPAMEAMNASVETIEGLSKDGELHPLQQAFIDHGAVQCGYCTPGMIMSAKALLDKNTNPSEDEIKEAIGGNLCRCTGYVKIVEAIKAAAEVIRER